jgi:DNA-binding transcriptional ArsR family regulator
MYNNINDFKPEQLHVLTDSEQIKAYVHPTRITLLRLLAKERRTISSIAGEQGVHPANITHHFRLLEKNGLIRLVGKKDTGKNIEKYYRAIAYNFIVNPDAEQGGKGVNKNALALSILRDNLAVAVKTVSQNADNDVLALLGGSRLTPEDIRKMTEKLNGIIREFKDYDSPNGIPYNLNLSIYPNDISYTSLPGQEIIL